MLSIRDPPQNKRSTQENVKGLKKIFQANGHEIPRKFQEKTAG